MEKFGILFDGVLYNINMEDNNMGGTSYKITGEGPLVANYNSFDKGPDTVKLARYALQLASLILADPEPMEDLGMRVGVQHRFVERLLEIAKQSMNFKYKEDGGRRDNGSR